MTAGGQALRVLAIAPKAIWSAEMTALPVIALHPLVPARVPSAAISKTVCKLSITPPPLMSSASHRPAGEGASGWVLDALNDNLGVVQAVREHGMVGQWCEPEFAIITNARLQSISAGLGLSQSHGELQKNWRLPADLPRRLGDYLCWRLGL